MLLPPAIQVTLRVRMMMQMFTGSLVLSLALAASASPYGSRIVGGFDAPEGKYPYQVSLWRNGEFYCGGSIINDRYILTAAHCLYKLNEHEVTVGIGNRLLNETVDLNVAEKLIPHYEYNPMTFRNDIGLIRLAKKIVYGDKIKPIPMTTQDFTQENYPVTLTGWGRLYAGGPVPNCLQEIELKIIDQKVCERFVRGQRSLGSKQICTFTKRGEGVCNGDSGGPLVVDGYQIGVVSFAIPCAVGVPDVFTRVHSYLDWIAENVADDHQ